MLILQELRAKLEAARDANASLKKQLVEGDGNRKGLEKQVMDLKEDLDNTKRAKEDAKRDAYRYKSSAEVVGRYVNC